MNHQFYIASNGQQLGPFGYEDLKQQNIQRNTLLWTEGLETWTKAELVPMVKDLFRNMPPPLPSQESTQTVPPLPGQTRHMTGEKYFGYQLAKRRERFFAALVETVILTIPILFIVGNEVTEDSPFTFESFVLGTLFAAVVGAICYPLWSGNIGHKILGLKVISSENGEDQSKPAAGALREGLKNIFSFVIIPAIWLIWDADKQNLYDKVSKTIVVRKK